MARAKSTGYKYYQPNRKDIKDEFGDCVIRALCKATGKQWIEIFDELVPYVRDIQANPNAPQVFSKYLGDRGFQWVGLRAEKGKKRPTVESFAREHKDGTYILSVAHHLVTVSEGFYWDTWDSGYKSVYGYYKVSDSNTYEPKTYSKEELVKAFTLKTLDDNWDVKLTKTQVLNLWKEYIKTYEESTLPKQADKLSIPERNRIYAVLGI